MELSASSRPRCGTLAAMWSQKTSSTPSSAVREYIENHRDEINAGVREALAQLDGTKGSVVSMLTGFDAAKLTELGGMVE